MKKIIAVASGGGHWIQLMRLRKVFEGHNTIFIGVKDIYREEVSPNRFYTVPDVSRIYNKKSILFLAAKLLYLLFKERPDIVLTTGALPGMLALRFGKLFGAKTIWVDSIANVEEMSLSGRKANEFADLCLTQWSHLAKDDGPKFWGSVL